MRLVVPWKYGFKSGKSIVKIRFTDKEPRTAWNKAAANEYGFYSMTLPQGTYNIVISYLGYSAISETFRSIRTNLKYMIPDDKDCKIILFAVFFLFYISQNLTHY